MSYGSIKGPAENSAVRKDRMDMMKLSYGNYYTYARHGRTDGNRYNIYSTTVFNQYMYSVIVYNISNEWFTGLCLTLHKTLNLFNTAFFILPLASLLPNY